MCGIAVAVNWPAAESVVNDVISGLSHRGLVTDPILSAWQDTAMVTRRLPIVDASGGSQPKLSYDGRILVAFNGELYNHLELRIELEALGVRFETISDTEVLANAIASWGSQALAKFVGMYAFVALDLVNRDFLAARDPFGVKPLYVIQADSRFLFSSELRPLLHATSEGDALLIPPGYLLTKKFCVPAPHPSPSLRQDLAGDTLGELDMRLSRAVETRLPQDLPVALMFSGGIDSTLVAHYARRVRPEMPGYFVGSPNSPDYPFASAYADMTGLDFRCIPLELEPNLDRILEIVTTVESFEPDLVRNGYCTYQGAKQMNKDGFLVALSGEGADELFAGYRPLEITFMNDAAVGQNIREQYLESMGQSNLQRLDRCTMAFHIEMREPFLDPSVVEYARSLTGSDLVDRSVPGGRGKAPLRALYTLYPDALPSVIQNRSKVPLSEGAGFNENYRTSPWGDFAEAFVSDAIFKEEGKKYSEFNLKTKEEYLYFSILALTLDVERVPHLKRRHQLLVPHFEGIEAVQDWGTSIAS